MELLRKIFAALIGIIILILVVLVAKWTGEKIKEKFFSPKTPSVIEVENSTEGSNLVINKNKETYTSIPQTGPELFGLVALGFSAVGGVATRFFSKKS